MTMQGRRLGKSMLNFKWNLEAFKIVKGESVNFIGWKNKDFLIQRFADLGLEVDATPIKKSRWYLFKEPEIIGFRVSLKSNES